ncbi:MAG: adenosine deaminase [Chloroflexota bacterium]
MTLQHFITDMPKVELHIHIEGSILPKTLFELAERNNVTLPSTDVNGLREWYTFRDFDHFIEIYLKIVECLKTPDDIEYMGREFLREQARQNIKYTEATWTPWLHYNGAGIRFEDQLAALNRARAWARDELGVDMQFVPDIPRNLETDGSVGMMTAEWAVSGMGNGIVGIGVGGAEVGYPPEMFKEAFAYAQERGLPGIPHAGETDGPSSIWGAIRDLKAKRLYHGVRAIEDPELMDYLRDTQISLDLCPTSNVRLGVVPDLKAHMLPKLIAHGLYITINSDDPPMFNTTLTNEYIVTAAAFGFDAAQIEGFVMNAVNASLLADDRKATLRGEFEAEFARLHAAYL